MSAMRIGNDKSNKKKAMMINIKFKKLKLITENIAVIIFLRLRLLLALFIAFVTLISLAILLGFPRFLEIFSSDFPSLLYKYSKCHWKFYAMPLNMIDVF